LEHSRKPKTEAAILSDLTSRLKRLETRVEIGFKDMADIKNLLRQVVTYIETTFKALETDAKIIQQNTEAIESFNRLMKDLASPRKPPENDRTVV